VGSWTGLVVKSDPGQAVIWLAFGCLIGGLVLTFYFPRRRVWARLADGRLGFAFLADPHVDRDREFSQLVEVLESTLRARTPDGRAPSEPANPISARR
jgi:cytochrome c biogenesis protein ResB